MCLYHTCCVERQSTRQYFGAGVYELHQSTSFIRIAIIATIAIDMHGLQTITSSVAGKRIVPCVAEQAHRAMQSGT